ncbi:TPA: restriction endonuclease subunit S [Klebsiella pneumoniae]|uniref:restriction endonuclease subunit S n=1 Tax=Klebsiella pneumoniae TaxID=573 RepID=UPI000E2CBA9A|nr:restriction endonuclease subunit S [Klebsiella pneumoniae]MDI7517428.1 restriction endonuclease subunit S [Cronobacter sakazakii]MBC5760653.1 restriction endonuclease subunit S [Klebsiella pneumoniae]MBQ5102465.1 restriction endonuclease subunit S [Klebsiella pneumoniae]WQO22896.1 restriction endonuclease subunit S [Klebsiella pneumoniae subsp. pneumoniae]SWM04971.1 type I restriction-modification system [Klebsiella pneumoniae]
MNDLSFPNIWLSRKALDCFIQISTNNRNVKTKDCKSEGLYPVIDQGQQFICGYIDDESKVIQVSNPLCVFGDHTRIIKWVTQDFVPGADGTKILEAEKFIFPKYGYYALRFIDIPDKGYSRHFKYLRELEIPISSLAEQKIIADKLDDLLARVESIKTRLENIPEILKKFRQSVLSTEFDYEIDDFSSLKNMELKDICRSISDGDHQAPPKSNSGIPFLVISDVNKGFVDFDNAVRRVPLEYYDNLKDIRKPDEKDILYTVTGSFGIPVLITDNAKFCFQRHIAIIKPNHELIFYKYLYFYLKSPEVFKYAQRVATGTAQKTVSLSNLRKFKIRLPSIFLQKKVVRKIEALFLYADTIEKKSIEAMKNINQLTQSILAKAFRGELTAQWREENPELISGLNSAEALLEKITAEKLAAGTIKKRAKKTSH